jgi:hypothetical protein
MQNDPGEAVRENYRKQGASAETVRMLQLLNDLNVLRPSMFGGDWYVIYTEHGPIDISTDTLLGKANDYMD